MESKNRYQCIKQTTEGNGMKIFIATRNRKIVHPTIIEAETIEQARKTYIEDHVWRQGAPILDVELKEYIQT